MYLSSIALVALLLISGSAGAQEVSPSHRAKIETLMEVTGARDLGSQMGGLMVQQMFTAMRQADPGLRDDTFQILEEVTIELFEERSDELIDQTITVYARHFTEDEIGGLVEFYRSPIGQKAVRVLPSIMQEVAPLSQAWAASLRPELERRIRSRLSGQP